MPRFHERSSTRTLCDVYHSKHQGHNNDRFDVNAATRAHGGPDSRIPKCAGREHQFQERGPQILYLAKRETRV